MSRAYQLFFMEPNECPATFAAKLVSMRRYVYPSAPFRGIVECNLAAAEATDEARAEVTSAIHGGPALAGIGT